MTRLQFELVPRVEQLPKLDISALGFPLPFFGVLGVLRCLDDVPPSRPSPGAAAATPMAGSEGTGARQLVTIRQYKQFKGQTNGQIIKIKGFTEQL